MTRAIAKILTKAKTGVVFGVGDKGLMGHLERYYSARSVAADY